MGKPVRLKPCHLVPSAFQGPGPNNGGNSCVHIIQVVEATLKRLDMDYFDIYYVHHTDMETSMEETLRAMEDLVRQSRVRYKDTSGKMFWW